MIELWSKRGRRAGKTAAMVEFVASAALQPGTLMMVSPPSKAEAQLMKGMTLRERAEFQALCGRVVVIRNLGQ